MEDIKIMNESGETQTHKFHVVYEDESFDIIRDEDYLNAAIAAKEKRKEQDKFNKIVKVVDMSTGDKYTEVEKDIKSGK